MTNEKYECGSAPLPTAEQVIGCDCLIRDLGELLARLHERGVTYHPLKGDEYQELVGDDSKRIIGDGSKHIIW